LIHSFAGIRIGIEDAKLTGIVHSHHQMQLPAESSRESPIPRPGIAGEALSDIEFLTTVCTMAARSGPAIANKKDLLGAAFFRSGNA